MTLRFYEYLFSLFIYLLLFICFKIFYDIDENEMLVNI